MLVHQLTISVLQAHMALTPLQRSLINEQRDTYEHVINQLIRLIR